MQTANKRYDDCIQQFAAIQKPFHEHQKVGIKWMLEKEANGHGGILADDPGLGKTFQALALIASSPFSSTLVVVPTSILGQWETASKLVLGNSAVHLHYGKRPRVIPQKMMVLTTYGILLSDKHLANISWFRVILDEVHVIKNRSSKTSKAAMQVPARYRWGLSGTPIQNTAEEAKNLFRFVAGFSSDSRVAIDLPEMIRTRLLRRRKEVVLTKLPTISIESIEVTFATLQERDFYNNVRNNVKAEFKELQEMALSAQEENVAIFELLLRLRQASQHPKLVLDGFARKYKETPRVCEQFLTKAAKWAKKPPSSKHLVLLEEIQKHPYESSLIFCQFTSEMDILEGLLAKTMDVFRLDGSMTKQRRIDTLNKVASTAPCANSLNLLNKTGSRFWQTNQSGTGLIDAIQTFMEPRVFLIQIKAGGVGLNLQAFSRVYITTPDWNPCNEIQAIARSHRLGQTRDVKVVKLILKAEEDEPLTIDDRICAIQLRKRGLMSDLLNEDTLRYNDNRPKLTNRDRKTLLG